MGKELPSWQPSASKAEKARRKRYIIYLVILVCSIWLLKSLFFSSSHTRIQHKKFQGKKPRLAQTDRLKVVKAEFEHAWYGYRNNAWKANTLKPLNGGENNRNCAWAGTVVDSLDTLWIMDMKDQFDDAVKVTAGINFKHSAATCQINLVDATVRWLGGMIAAYDLSQDQRLLPKIAELGNLLHGQFNTHNGMPCSNCRLLEHASTHHQTPRDTALSDIGSFHLEFSRLAQITGEKKFAEIVNHLTTILETHQESSSIPGLWPERVDTTTVDLGPTDHFATASHTFSLGTLSDSTYEYLVKTHLLLGGQTKRYAQMWFKASIAIVHNLLFRAYLPSPSPKHPTLFTGIATHQHKSDSYLLEPRLQQSSCYTGSLFALSSRLFNHPADLELSKELTQGCIWAWQTSPLGIMPETVTVMTCPQPMGAQCAWNQTYYDHAQPAKDMPPGFLYSKNPRYLLRGDIAESLFVMYRVTGDAYYRDAAWRIFQAIVAQTRTSYGHAGLANVMRGPHASKAANAVFVDDMDPVWLAQTLKYFYLVFADPGTVSLDHFVFNTHGHPLKLTKGVRAP
ncbi:hypothetical protein R6Q59_010047 [Mikania micrantha]